MSSGYADICAARLARFELGPEAYSQFTAGVRLVLASGYETSWDGVLNVVRAATALSGAKEVPNNQELALQSRFQQT